MPTWKVNKYVLFIEGGIDLINKQMHENLIVRVRACMRNTLSGNKWQSGRVTVILSYTID